MPFSQSRLSNQFLTLEDGGELPLFLLAILDLGILLQLGHGRGICIVNAFIIIVIFFTVIMWYSLVFKHLLLLSAYFLLRAAIFANGLSNAYFIQETVKHLYLLFLILTSLSTIGPHYCS